MDTKTYLQQIERLDRKIQNKFAEIEQLKTMATSISVAQRILMFKHSQTKTGWEVRFLKLLTLNRKRMK